MKKKLVLVLGLVMALMAFALPVLAVEGEWELSDIQLPDARGNFGSCFVEGKLYVIGGMNDSTTYMDTVYAYDFGTRLWEQKADLPVAIAHLTTVYLDGKIYAIGGHRDGMGVVNTAYEYDSSNDTWTIKANMPVNLNNPSVTVAEGKIYVCGGATGTGVSSALYVYEPQNNTWTKKSNMLTAVIGSQKLVYQNGEIYFFGGVDNNYTGISSCQKYNIFENKWYRIADMPTPRYASGSVTIGNEVYIIGGRTNTFYDEVHKYSLDTDTWEQVESFPSIVINPGVEYINDQIYVFGGHDEQNKFDTVYTYTPSTPPVVTTGNVLLRVYITNGLELEYDTTMTEMNNFVNWFNARANGSGPAVYSMKKTGNFGPFSSRTDYLVFDKIVNWEVNEYDLP